MADFFSSWKQSGEGSDITFEVGPEKELLHAHRLILTARCEIFYAMLRKNSMRESENGHVRIEDHSPEMVAKMLEFIYTNRVSDIGKLSSNVSAHCFSVSTFSNFFSNIFYEQQLVDLLTLAEQYLLEPLKHRCELAAKDVLSVSNIGRFLCASERFHATYLKEYCLDYFVQHMSEIIDDENFKEEIETCPGVALVILRASARASSMPSEPVAKRRRLNMPYDDAEF